MYGTVNDGNLRNCTRQAYLSWTAARQLYNLLSFVFPALFLKVTQSLLVPERSATMCMHNMFETNNIAEHGTIQEVENKGESLHVRKLKPASGLIYLHFDRRRTQVFPSHLTSCSSSEYSSRSFKIDRTSCSLS